MTHANIESTAECRRVRDLIAAYGVGGGKLDSDGAALWHMVECDACHAAYCAALPDPATIEPTALGSRTPPLPDWLPVLARHRSGWFASSWEDLKRAVGEGIEEAASVVSSLRLFLYSRRRLGMVPTLGAPSSPDLIVLEPVEVLEDEIRFGPSEEPPRPVVSLNVLSSGWDAIEPSVPCAVVSGPTVTRKGELLVVLRLPDRRFAGWHCGCMVSIQSELPPIQFEGCMSEEGAGLRLEIRGAGLPVQQELDLDLTADDVRYYVRQADDARETEGSRPAADAENAVQADGDVIVISDDRYLVYRLIPGWDLDTVRGARIFVVGTGALGNEVIKNLALMGIGTIVVVDFDTVAKDNLSRSVLFRGADAGRRKVEVVRERVREINPDVRVMSVHEDVFRLGLGYFHRADVVISCIDSYAGRQAVNEACWLLGKPWIDGGLGDEKAPFDGYVHTFVPRLDVACFECTLTAAQRSQLDARQGCGELALRLREQRKVPTTPTCASIVGGIQAQEALKLLHGKSLLANKRAYLPGADYDMMVLTYPVSDQCTTHQGPPGVAVRSLPQCRASSSTARDVLAAVGAADGALLLREQFVTEVWCTECGGTHRPVNAAVSLMADRDRMCEKHGIANAFSGFTRIERDDDAAGWILSRLGVPALDIVALALPRADGSTEYAYCELSGDADEPGLS